LDIQELSIIVITTKNFDEIRLCEKKSEYQFPREVTRTFIDQQKWKLYNYVKIRHQASYDEISINSKPIAHNLSDKPHLCATLFVSRQPQYYFWNAYFLTFLITIMSFSIFAIDCKFIHNRLSSSFTLILTSISFKWVVNRSLPTVSYLTSLDKYEISNIFLLCMVATGHTIVSSVREPKFAKILDNYFLFLYFFLFIVIHFILFVWILKAYRKIWALKKKVDAFKSDGSYRGKLRR
jgi:hypothetical protein